MKKHKQKIILLVFIMLFTFSGCQNFELYTFKLDDLTVVHNVLPEEKLTVHTVKRNIIKNTDGEETVEYDLTFTFNSESSFNNSIQKSFSEEEYKRIVGNANIIKSAQYQLEINILPLTQSYHKPKYVYNRFSALGEEDFSEEEIDIQMQKTLDSLNGLYN